MKGSFYIALVLTGAAIAAGSGPAAEAEVGTRPTTQPSTRATSRPALVAKTAASRPSSMPVPASASQPAVTKPSPVIARQDIFIAARRYLAIAAQPQLTSARREALQKEIMKPIDGRPFQIDGFVVDVRSADTPDPYNQHRTLRPGRCEVTVRWESEATITVRRLLVGPGVYVGHVPTAEDRIPVLAVEITAELSAASALSLMRGQSVRVSGIASSVQVHGNADWQAVSLACDGDGTTIIPMDKAGKKP